MLTTLLGNRRMDSGDEWTSGWYNTGARKTTAGVCVTPSKAFTYAAVWAATRYLCGVMGSMPLNYYSRNGGSRELLSDDPLQYLIHDRPNPWMSSADFVALLTNWQVNWGNGYAEIQWVTDGVETRPYALWPLHPVRVKPTAVINAATNEEELVYEVKPPFGQHGEPRYIDPESILHIRHNITADGVIGIGVITQARETIGGGLAGEEEANRTFSTGRMPKVVVESPGKPSPESRTNFRKEWREIHTEGKFDVALLAEGMKANALSFNLRDSQFLESRMFSIEEMARWYGLPPQKLQHLLRTSYNSAEQLNTECVTDTLVPLAVQWEKELAYKLTPEVERPRRMCKFSFQGLLRGDTNARGNFYRTMVGIGAMNRNEVRELEDYNPVPGGDTFLTQGANVALDENGEPEPPAAAQTPPTDPAGPEATEEMTPIQNVAAIATELSRVRIGLKAAAKTMLRTTLERMVQREAIAAKRAASKPAKFLEWMEEFYPEHSHVVGDALSPVMTACEPFGMKNEPQKWATAICDQSRTRLLNLAGECKPDTLAEAVSALMGEWEASRAADIVAGIAELN